jgi:hypothetical protein
MKLGLRQLKESIALLNRFMSEAVRGTARGEQGGPTELAIIKKGERFSPTNSLLTTRKILRRNN